MLRLESLHAANQALPDFDDPPVVEVAMAVQFDPIAGLIPPIIGLFWSRLRDRYPHLEVHPPRPPVVERFGLLPVQDRGPEVQLVDPSEAVRVWFVSKNGTELLQIQRDRIVFNWRRNNTDAQYPRYPNVRETFVAHLNEFRQFLTKERLGDMSPNQCELTYVNHISLPGNKEHSRVDEVVTVWNNVYSESSLGPPEDVRFAARYVMISDEGDPVGRLHVVLEPAYRAVDKSQILALHLTARGQPQDRNVSDALEFLDDARDLVVRTFATITQPAMHQQWGRRS